MKQLILLKLGGSLITDKTKPLTDKPKLIKQLAEEVAELHKNMPGTRLIVGTGAGSFGHYLVQKNGMSTHGPLMDKETAVEQIHDAVKGLNSQFVEALQAKGTGARQVSGAEILSASPSIASTLKDGAILVVYGDAVVEGEEYRIISTEELFEALIEQLASSYEDISVVFAASVDGVLDGHSRVIPEITRDNEQAVEWSAAEGYDVTGGMEQKLAAAFRLLKRVQSVRIINGQVEGNITKAVSGRPVGTLVK